MRLTGEKLPLGHKRPLNPWRILILLALIFTSLLILRLREAGKVQPLFLATPTPTRNALTYVEEAEAHFSAGNLPAAIEAYRQAVEVNPNDATLWAQLARVLTYASDLETTFEGRQALLEEARQAVDRAVEIDDENSFAYAIRALVYDWSAAAEIKEAINPGDTVRVQATIGDGGALRATQIELETGIAGGPTASPPADQETVLFSGVVESLDEREWVVSGRRLQITPFTVIREANRRDAFLAEAQAAAVRARQLDQGNSLALAFLAEVRVDEGNVAQAADLAKKAVELAEQRSENDPYLMDIHRVYATVFENQGLYLRAIEEYLQAARVSPNLTFLYLNIGTNYRALRDFDTALTYFDKAARINEQIGIEDPNPYLAIGNTYAREGEFFIASINMERALAIDPTNPQIYARLGTVYFQARNYESAIPVFKCALDGCSAQESGDLMCELGVYSCEPGSDRARQIGQDVQGLPLTTDTVEYYYTYGSALTFYAGEPAYPTACDDAERIFQELMAKYGRDPLVAAIVDEGRAICAAPNATPTPPIATPTP